MEGWNYKDRYIDRQPNRQIDRQIDRQLNRWIDRPCWVGGRKVGWKPKPGQGLLTAIKMWSL